ncbi:MAG: hypothetical protein AAGC53_08505 [Actinomycetota bacterium]
MSSPRRTLHHEPGSVRPSRDELRAILGGDCAIESSSVGFVGLSLILAIEAAYSVQVSIRNR